MLLRHRSQLVDVIQKVPLFADLSKRHLDLIARQVDQVEVKDGQTIVRQGENGREVVILVAGNVRVERDGKRIAEMGPGDFFGEMALLDGKPRQASVIAEENGTILVIHSRAFGPLLDTVPGLGRKMLAALCGRMRELQHRFVD
jgi:CRP/FNR family transcriptional regulator, cyclic AMP receptor protein